MTRMSRVRDTAKQKKAIIDTLKVIMDSIKVANEVDYSTIDIKSEQEDFNMIMGAIEVGEDGYISRPLTGWNTLEFRIRYKIAYRKKRKKKK